MVQFGETVYRDKERWSSLYAIMLLRMGINKERKAADRSALLSAVLSCCDSVLYGIRSG